MKIRPKTFLTSLAPVAMACWVGNFVSMASAQSPTAQTGIVAQAKAANAKGQTAGEFFKNVTTSTLKGLTPSDFLGAMGGYDGCRRLRLLELPSRRGDGSNGLVTDSNPKKVTARKMVEMVAAIN